MANNTMNRLQKVPASSLNEEQRLSFLGWLQQSNNIDFLKKVIGEDISLNPEISPNNNELHFYTVDSKQKVLVLTLFEKSNDTALSALFQAMAKEPSITCIWITEQISEKHRSILNWLNITTNDSVKIYSLDLEFWHIDNSSLAPSIKLAASPSVQKILRKKTSPIATKKQKMTPFPLSTQPELQFVEYWLAFNTTLLRRKSHIIGQKPRPINWMAFPVNNDRFHLFATMNPEHNFLAVGLTFIGKNAQSHYDELKRINVAIEKEMGCKLEWQNQPDKNIIRILVRKLGISAAEQQEWGQQHEWLVTHLEKLEALFAQHLDLLDADDVRKPFRYNQKDYPSFAQP